MIPKKYDAIRQAATLLSDHTMTLQITSASKQITLYAVTLNVWFGWGVVFSPKLPQFFSSYPYNTECHRLCWNASNTLKIRREQWQKVTATYSLPPPPTDFSSHGTRGRIKSPSNQVSPKHTHHTNNSSFVHIFQIVRPVRSLGSLRHTSTNESDMPGLSDIRTWIL